MTRITLIRHGQTWWNTDGRWQGQANVGLNPTGLAQASRVAEHLRGVDVSALYSSDLIRARQTAEAIAECMGVPVITDVRLREIDVGEWQGLTGDEVLQWDAERLYAVRAGGYSVRRPSGESLQEVADRALALFKEVVAAYPGKHVILVSHGGTIRMLLYALQLLDDTHTHVDNTSRTVLVRAESEASWQLDAFNQVDHLPTPDDNQTAPSHERPPR
ncbi:MAG: histidine phosphatase family protein [Aggregatilineales bacterium]